MHSNEERSSVLSTILQTARGIALHDPSCSAGQAAWEYLQFCTRHGYVGFPTDSPEGFSVGGYLRPGRSGSPTTSEEAQRALGIIVCFSDEVMPCNPMRKTTLDGAEVMESGYVSPTNRILVIGYADWHTSVELALKLLHEARHARQYFGIQFENLPVLDPDEVHESRTWKYELDLLDACGGHVWQQAVAQELILLTDRYALRGRSPGEKYFAMSGQTYPALDQLFGSPVRPAGGAERNLLVAMRANFRLAENAQLPDLDRAYANIIGAYYDWSKKK